MNIVFLEPENPRNTGAIGRTCVCTGTKLHLIKPFSFDLSEKAIKKSGLDYWHRVDLHIYEDFEDFLKKNNYPKIFMATTKAEHTYADVSYSEDSFVMFGKESKGIPEDILKKYRDTCIRIPMKEDERSLNLSTSASIILYEALRQTNFAGLMDTGELHNSRWKEL